MGFTLSYKTLFEVRLLHHFFLDRASDLFDNMDLAGKSRALKGYDVREFINIEPTAACAKVLRKYHFIYKNTPLGLIVGTRANFTGGKYFPALGLDDTLQFTFKVSFGDIFFSNYTALPLLQTKDAVYFFQNISTASPKKFPYLAQFAPIDTGDTYSAGELLGNAATNPTKLFMANKLTVAAPPGADWTEDALVVGKPLQYVTRNDLLPVYADAIRYNTGETGLNLSVKITNRQGEVINPPFETATQDGKSVALVDIHLLPEDFYTIELKDPGKPYTKTFSFHRLLQTDDLDGLINISVKSNDSTFDLTAGDGSLKEPVFELRFKNRSTIWRYLGEKFTNAPVSGPHPLTKKGVVPVTVKDKDMNDITDMPNANIRMIKTEHPPADNKHYDVVSEIYVH